MTTLNIEIISICPRCGTRLYDYKADLLHGDVIMRTPPPFRSDGYSPNSPYQTTDLCQCSKCGGYFMSEELNVIEKRMAEIKPHPREIKSSDFDSIKEALLTLDLSAIAPKRRRWLYLDFIHSYNTRFSPLMDEEYDEDYDYTKWTLLDTLLPDRPKRADRKLFKSVVLELCSILGDDELFLQAELLREAGKFRRSIKLLEKLRKTDNLPHETQLAVETCLRLCHARKCQPFTLPSE